MLPLISARMVYMGILLESRGAERGDTVVPYEVQNAGRKEH